MGADTILILTVYLPYIFSGKTPQHIHGTYMLSQECELQLIFI